MGDDLHGLGGDGLVLILDCGRQRLSILGVARKGRLIDVYPQVHDFHRIGNRVHEIEAAGNSVIDLTEGLHDADLGLIHDFDAADQHRNSEDDDTAADDRTPDDAENFQPVLIVLVLWVEPFAKGGGDGEASDGDDREDNKQNNHFIYSFLCNVLLAD